MLAAEVHSVKLVPTLLEAAYHPWASKCLHRYYSASVQMEASSQTCNDTKHASPPRVYNVTPSLSGDGKPCSVNTTLPSSANPSTEGLST